MLGPPLAKNGTCPEPIEEEEKCLLGKIKKTRILGRIVNISTVKAKKFVLASTVYGMHIVGVD